LKRRAEAEDRAWGVLKTEIGTAKVEGGACRAAAKLTSNYANIILTETSLRSEPIRGTRGHERQRGEEANNYGQEQQVREGHFSGFKAFE